MDMNSGFGEILETGRSSVRKVQKSTAKGVSDFAKTASTQVSSQSTGQDQGTNEAGTASTQQQMSDDSAKQFLRDLYGAKDKNQNQQPLQAGSQGANKTQTNVKTALGLGTSSGKAPTPTETIKTALGIPEPTPEKTHPAQNQNAVLTAMGVHQSDPNAGKTPEEIAKLEGLRSELHRQYYESLTKSKKPGEEHVTEKIEREDEEKKMSELEVQKEKPPPIAVQRVQQSAEKFRGVSG